MAYQTAAGGGAEGVDIERQEVVATEAITGTDTALSDTLDDTPKSSASVVLLLNGAKMVQGAGDDYTISGGTITWLASSGTAPDMTTADKLIACYVAGDGSETEQQEEITANAITGTDTDISTDLSNLPKSDESVRLWLNGVYQLQGAGLDYVMNGKTITWLAGSGTADDLDTSDEIEVWYVTGGGRDSERHELVEVEAVSEEDRELADLLNTMPKNGASVMLFHNGILQQRGVSNDYVLSGAEIEWLASSGTAVDLTTEHTLAAAYIGDGAVARRSVHGDFLTNLDIDDATSTSSAFSTKGTLTTDSVPPGKYRVAWEFQILGASSDTPEARVQFNGNTLHVFSGQDNPADASVRPSSQGSKLVEVTASGAQEVTLDFRRKSGSTTVNLVNAKLSFYREN